MKRLLLILLFFQPLLYLTACQQPPAINCLPENIRLTDIVSRELASLISIGKYKFFPINKDKITTVADELNKLKARCENSQLVDSSGKEIRFYQLTGCWGAAPANYQELMAQQRAHIEALQEQYTLILMTCNPDGIPYP